MCKKLWDFQNWNMHLKIIIQRVVYCKFLIFSFNIHGIIFFLEYLLIDQKDHKSRHGHQTVIFALAFLWKDATSFFNLIILIQIALTNTVAEKIVWKLQIEDHLSRDALVVSSRGRRRENISAFNVN